ncbi:helix-turn-helix domain-containing protein [Paenibacillus sp. FSL H8-0122]|uniref:helix-turn-helix domain-containing protein n=1 Tax=Paenibacillus sp. FSL H8-0122 TaxID=2954510 RepID=UPI0030FA5032
MTGPFKERAELVEFLGREILSTSEAMELMECSRQNLHKFVKSGKLVPVKDTGRERWFLRSECLERKEAAQAYHTKKDKPGD